MQVHCRAVPGRSMQLPCGFRCDMYSALAASKTHACSCVPAYACAAAVNAVSQTFRPSLATPVVCLASSGVQRSCIVVNFHNGRAQQQRWHACRECTHSLLTRVGPSTRSCKVATAYAEDACGHARSCILISTARCQG